MNNNISLKEVTKVAVHDFIFHADDVVAVALIKLCYNKDVSVSRVSARDIEVQARLKEEGCVLVDVGGGAFDHHQPATEADMYHNGVRMSAVGKVLEACVRDGKMSAEVRDSLLEGGLYALQAEDNGQDFTGVAPNYFSFVRWMNSNDRDSAEGSTLGEFLDAVNVAVKMLAGMIKDAEVISDERAIFNAAAENMAEHVINFPKYLAHGNRLCQEWNNVNRDSDQEVLFYTFPGRDGAFMIQAVNHPNSFRLLKPLPFPGTRDSDLNAVAGIGDGIFVHLSGFLGSCETLESCHKLAKAAIAMDN